MATRCDLGVLFTVRLVPAYMLVLSNVWAALCSRRSLPSLTRALCLPFNSLYEQSQEDRELHVSRVDIPVYHTSFYICTSFTCTSHKRLETYLVDVLALTCHILPRSPSPDPG